MSSLSPRARRLLAAALTAILAALVAAGIVVVNDDGTVTIKATPADVALVDDGDRDTARDNAIVLPDGAVDQTARKLEQRGAEIAHPLREPDDPSRTPAGQLEGPLAADQVPGCRNRLVGNFSSRNGVRPQVIYLHETVSYENGWRSQDNLTAYASRRSSGVSWHLLLGRTNGLCTYTVPLHMKAWTQANANPFSIGIEVEAHASQGRYVEGKGKAKLLSVLRYLSKRFGIPLQRAIVRNGRVIRGGIGEHSDLGAFGGGHADVTHLNEAQLNALISEARAGGFTGTDKTTCRKLNAWRNAGRPRGGQWERNSVRRRIALTARGVTCTVRGPVRT